MASHQLIDEHLARLSRRLPDDAVDELADGLIETWRRHVAAGLMPAHAAQAAITEFGTPEQILEAFVIQSSGRRAARMLLITGPLVGGCWGAGLAAARIWSWPVPALAVFGFGLALLSVVATLITAAGTRRSYRRARLGTAGGIGLVVLDLVMLSAVVRFTPALAWPVLPAAAASLARIGLTLRSLPSALAR
ncbi:MAG: hypothetical protein QOE51_389 [Actinoplanes sp.]|nr:hypothetical protein [Actinoplanes sp.]